MLAVKIAFSDAEKVHENEHPDKGAANNGARLCGARLLGEAVPKEHAPREKNENEAPPGVAAQHSPAVLPQRLHKDVLHPLVALRRETSCKAREKGEKKAEASRESERPIKCAANLPLIIFPPCNPVQSDESQKRHRHLKHREGHRDCSELAVHRCVVEPQFGEPQEMAAPGEENCDESGYDYPDFLPAVFPLKEEKPQDEKEYAHGPEIHRPCGERLRSPVHRERLHGLFHVRLSGPSKKAFGGAVFKARVAGGSASVEVGNQEVRHLVRAVGPGGGILEVESLRGGFRLFHGRSVSGVFGLVGGEFGAAPHRVFRIIIGRDELVGIGRYAHAPKKEQQG